MLDVSVRVRAQSILLHMPFVEFPFRDNFTVTVVISVGVGNTSTPATRFRLFEQEVKLTPIQDVGFSFLDLGIYYPRDREFDSQSSNIL